MIGTKPITFSNAFEIKPKYKITYLYPKSFWGRVYAYHVETKDGDFHVDAHVIEDALKAPGVLSGFKAIKSRAWEGQKLVKE